MTTVRRRVLRPSPPEPPVDQRQVSRLHRKREQLTKDRIAFKRWLTRLRRATNTVTELHQRIVRLEALLAVSG